MNWGDNSEWGENSASDTVGEIVLKVTNNNDGAVQLNTFSEGVVLMIGQQINLDYLTLGSRDLDGDIFLGASIISFIWFPIRLTMIDEISNITYHVGEVWDAETFRTIGSRIIVTTDLSEHIWEPLPKELGG